MNNIKIRQATASESDINGIVHVYRGQSLPWSNIKDCTSWTTKRLDRGFYIRLAEVDGNIVGHGEWVISDEPDRKFLYLGMLEIDKDYQRKGIGKAMIADGIEHAKKNNCTQAVTSPEVEDGADIFYRKCGFVDGRRQYGCKILTEPYKDYKFEGAKLDKVPFTAIKERDFVFGKEGQYSSRHMWEVMNEKPSVDVDRRTPAILLSDGTYVQIHTWEGNNGGGLYIWANSENYGEIIKSALSFGHSVGMRDFSIGYFKDEEDFLDGFEVYDKKQESDFEQIYYINESNTICLL